MTIVRNWIVPQIEPRTGGTNPPLITTTSLPNGTAGSAYSFTMSAVSGVPPYTWSLAGVSPDTGNWLSINAATGVLSGTPSVGEIETVRVQVTDSVSAPTAPTAFSLTVSSLPQLRVTTSSLPSAQVGSSYTGVTLAATGGAPPYTWVLTGAQPNWGRVWGTEGSAIPGGVFGAGVIPQMVETETLIFTVTDSVSNTASATLSLVVNAAGTQPGPAALWPGTVGLTSFAFGISPPASGPAPTAYNVYRNGVKVYNQSITPGGDSQLPYIEDRPLTNNTTYTWFATAIVNGLETGPSPTITATTLAAGPPAPPAAPASLTWIAPYALPTGTVWTCTNTSFNTVSGTGTLGNVGCSLNWAINGYSPGDVIVLTAGATYVVPTNSSTGYVFPNKANPTNLWTYVISSQDPVFNPSGTLPASSLNTTLGGGVTDYSGTSGNWVNNSNTGSMALIQTTAINGVGITFAPGANFLRFVGIWMAPVTGGTGPLTFASIGGSSSFPTGAGSATSGVLSTGFTGTTGTYSLIFSDNTARQVTLTNGSTAVSWSNALVNNVTATAGWQLGNWAGNYCMQMPFLPFNGSIPFQTPCESIYIDRCLFGLNPANLYAATNSFTFQSQCVYIYGNHISIQQCMFQGLSDYFQPQGTSPFYGIPSRESHAIGIGGGTNIAIRNIQAEAVGEAVFSGGGFVAQTVLPTDMTVAYSFIWKNPIWFTNGAVADFKNHIEFKCGIRINVHHNVCANNATGLVAPQNGHAIVAWANDNTFLNPWTVTTDVDVHDNLIVHTGSGIYFSGSDGGEVGVNDNIAWANNARMRFQNNIMYLDVLTSAINSLAQPWCMLLRFNVPDIIIDHNTTILNSTNPNWAFQAQFSAGTFSIGTNSVGQLYNASDGHTPNGRQSYSDRIQVTNNVMDGGNAFSGNGLGHGATTFSTIFPAQGSATVANNLYIIDTVHYTGNDFTATGYTGAGFTNFVNAQTLPLPPNISNWNITVGPHATGSTTGGPVGATF